MRASSSLLIACALGLAACSGGDTTPDGGNQPPVPVPKDGGPEVRPDGGFVEPPDAGQEAFKLEARVDATSITLPQGTTSEQVVQLVYDRSRVATATLSVTAATGGVSAEVDPATYDGRFEPLLRLRASNNATAGSQKVTLTARAADVERKIEITLNVKANADVLGIVVDQNGQPMQGVAVHAAGKTALTQGAPDATDPARKPGTFALVGVTPPYDLDVVDGAGQRAYRFVGLTRRDPRIQLAGMREATASWAVEGRLTGAGLTLTPQSTLWVGLAGAPARTKARTAALTGYRYANTPFTFHGPGFAGTLWGLVGVQDATGKVVAFDAFGQVPVSAAPAQQVPDQPLPVEAVKVGSVTATVAAPAGYSVTGSRAWLSMVDGSGLWLTRQGAGPADPDDFLDDHAPELEANDALQGNAFNYLAPLVTGARVTVSATATSGPRTSIARLSNLLPDHGAPTLALPAAPAITTPVADATLQASAEFAWSDDAAGRLYVAAWGSGVPGEPALVVVTKEKHATMPDLTSLGVARPQPGRTKLRVLAVAPCPTVDEAAGARGLRYDYLLPTKMARGQDRDGSAALDEVSFVLE